MISPLFNDTQYQSLRAMLDVSMSRHQALAGNVANINTPGYHRSDIDPTFMQELQRATQTGDMAKLQTLTPKTQVDDKSPSFRLDGNNVNLEREMIEIAQNSTQFEISAAMLAKRYQSLRMAITGRG